MKQKKTKKVKGGRLMNDTQLKVSALFPYSPIKEEESILEKFIVPEYVKKYFNEQKKGVAIFRNMLENIKNREDNYTLIPTKYTKYVVKSKSDIQNKSLDDLLKEEITKELIVTDQPNQQNQQNELIKVVENPIELLDDFTKHESNKFIKIENLYINRIL